MKKIILLACISLFLFSQNVFAETVVNHLNKRNSLYYADNSDTPFTGKQIQLNVSGQKEAEINYKYGKRDGLATTWYKNDQKEAKINYKYGKIDGLTTLWYDNGQKEAEINYKYGKRDGLAKTWYENGQQQAEMNYKSGNRDGLTTTWYENGQKNTVESFKDGRIVIWPLLNVSL